MATAVSPPTFFFPSGRRHSPRQGILLPQQQPHYDPPTFTDPRPITMGGSRSPCSRRIRFAPLPDPRRSVLITDDGNELPFPQQPFATQFPAPPTPSPTLDPRHDYFAVFECASLSSSSSDSKRNSDCLEASSSSASSTPGTATPVSITTTTPSEYDNMSSVPASPIFGPPSPLIAVSNKLSAVSAQASSSRNRFSFLRSLKRHSVSSSSSSSNTLTPVASIDRTQTPTASSFSRRNFSAEEILTLGTINLFRTTSSRDTSDNEGASTSGWSLARWSSAGSTHSHREPNWGSPLARVSSTQSTQSYQSKSKSKFNASKNVRPTGLGPSRKGTRMLNGRVYGVKRPYNANPFANARDEEPEFVEWGYGGMGSVKGATSAGAHGRWERLHGQSVTATAAADEPGRPTEDDDDGSGMGWVKRRREQREREKKEQEEKETPVVEKANNDEKKETTTTTTPVKEVEKTAVRPERPVMPSRPGTAASAKTLTLPSRPGTASSAKTLSAGSSTTITPCASSIPTPHLTPATSSTHMPPVPSAAAATATSAVSSANGEEEHVTRAINIPAPHHYHHHRGHARGGSKDVTAEVKETIVEHRESENESRSNSESESESDVEHEDEEDDSDSEEEEEKRKTALGAGVEKISRHH
ncbi:hypothetical protein P691DRAFT_759509 [Macrolepiota fuliginosa MF-IS2]|uniref:Uncharacterized protein n=1 Tax=Macrolepiota fuliginosa MF-IS2 TaxID=1400762 RepID=A0A9P6C1W2_9AGAR|nr:hypothetical protein P691DRAFT_759509 [Macrolepiota fuliginosa MF-IS2]